MDTSRKLSSLVGSENYPAHSARCSLLGVYYEVTEAKKSEFFKIFAGLVLFSAFMAYLLGTPSKPVEHFNAVKACMLSQDASPGTMPSELLRVRFSACRAEVASRYSTPLYLSVEDVRLLSNQAYLQSASRSWSPAASTNQETGSLVFWFKLGLIFLGRVVDLSPAGWGPI